jgi:hypothetical protein
MLRRWAAHLQNDFKARLEWCVNDVAHANHPPVPRVKGALRRTVEPGDRVVLDARDSTDPDKDTLKFEWLHYAEPSSYRGPALAIEGASSPQAAIVVPKVDSAQTVHIILIVTDQGSPPLTRYRRLILTVQPQIPRE